MQGLFSFRLSRSLSPENGQCIGKVHRDPRSEGHVRLVAAIRRSLSPGREHGSLHRRLEAPSSIRMHSPTRHAGHPWHQNRRDCTDLGEIPASSRVQHSRESAHPRLRCTLGILFWPVRIRAGALFIVVGRTKKRPRQSGSPCHALEVRTVRAASQASIVPTVSCRSSEPV